MSVIYAFKIANYENPGSVGGGKICKSLVVGWSTGTMIPLPYTRPWQLDYATPFQIRYQTLYRVPDQLFSMRTIYHCCSQFRVSISIRKKWIKNYQPQKLFDALATFSVIKPHSRTKVFEFNTLRTIHCPSQLHSC